MQVVSLVEKELERRRAFRNRTVIGGSFASKPIFVVDLSSTGFGATAYEPPAERGSFDLHLPDGQVRVQAELRWSKSLGPNMHHAGYEFSKFASPSDAEHLEHFVARLNTQQQRELAKGPLRSLSDPELERLALLARVSYSLNASHEYERTLRTVVEVLMETLRADRGLVLLDRGGTVPEVVVRMGSSARSHRGLEFSLMVVEEVLEKGLPLLSIDVEGDHVLSSSDSLRTLETISILCIPMRARGRNMGLIYLDSSSKSGHFKRADLELATIMADLAASAVERAEVFTKLLHGEKLAALGTLVAGLAHELRNPLDAIINLADMGRTGEGEPGDHDIIFQQAKRCERLIKDLLRAARGGDKTILSDVSVAGMFARVRDLVGAEFRSQKVTLVTEPGAPDLMVRADMEQSIQIFLNLLTNALQAVKGSAEPRVEWSVTASGGRAIFTVADNGPGIPPEAMGRVFDPFFTTRPESGGIGLGLAIILRLVEDQGGSVIATNRVGGGAMFQVTLPLA